MSDSALMRQVPIEDRRRELIAARHIMPVRRLYGTSETPQPESDILPVFLSSDEVIGLLAYGRTRALDGPVSNAPRMFERWSSHVTGGSSYERQYPLVCDMRLALARVRWWQLKRRSGAGPSSCPIKLLHRIARSSVRWAIRHHKTSAVRTIALLRTDVRQWIKACHDHEVAILQATAHLCAEIAADNIVAWGIPGVWRVRRYTTGLHEAIPAVFFANPCNTILPDGWATCGWDVPEDDWPHWKGPDWGDVRFKRDDVFTLRRRISSRGECQSVESSSKIGTSDARHRKGIAMSMQIDGGYISPLFCD